MHAHTLVTVQKKIQERKTLLQVIRIHSTFPYQRWRLLAGWLPACVICHAQRDVCVMIH